MPVGIDVQCQLRVGRRRNRQWTWLHAAVDDDRDANLRLDSLVVRVRAHVRMPVQPVRHGNVVLRAGKRKRRAVRRGVRGTLEGGMREEEILTEYPSLEPADIRAYLAYASELARVRFVDLSQAS